MMKISLKAISRLAPLLMLCLGFLAACSGRKAATLTSGDFSIQVSPEGGVLSMMKAGTLLKTAGPGPAGQVIYGDRTFPLADPVQSTEVDGGLRLAYGIEDIPLHIEIRYHLKSGREAVIFLRELVLRSDTKLRQDLTVKIPIGPIRLADGTWLPLKNGTGVELGSAPRAAYKFAGTHPPDSIPLAIPMVSHPAAPLADRCTIVTDPYFTTLFTRETVEWTYPKAVGLENNQEERSLALVFHAGDPDAAIRQFYDVALKEIPPGPDWLHDIAMVGFDFMARGGRGWYHDIDALEKAIPAADRAKVLLCNHGWYDFVGRYSFNSVTGTLDHEWTALSGAARAKHSAPTAVPVAMSLKKMHERMAYAKSRGFRVALYFGDGMNAGNGLADIYRPDRVLFWGGWEGPDTSGKTYCQNPLHPDVQSFFKKYLQALLEEYGQEIEALVWDETFHVDSGSLGSAELPGYADRAMMRLVRDLTGQVEDFNRRTGRQVVFLASDCIGIFDWLNKAPYALVADGTFQDSQCFPAGWSYGIFPNYRNVLWSCNWEPVKNYAYTEFGVRNYQAAVAISDSGEADQGFSNFSAGMKKKILDLFNWRKQFRTRLRWFKGLPVFEGEKK